MRGNSWINSSLALLYNATPITGIALNATAAPLTSIFVALHSADPGAGGTQSTSEATYVGYSRTGVVRTAAGWTVATETVQPVAVINFPQAPSTATGTLTFWSTGSLVTGAGTIFHSGPIGSYEGPFSALSSTNVLTIPAGTSLVVGSQVVFAASTPETLPGGIVSGTTYWVKTIAGDQVTLSATSGGAVLTITSDGTGYCWLSTPVTLGTILVTPSLTTATVITEQ